MVSSPEGCQMHVRSDSSQAPSSFLAWRASYAWWRREQRRCSASHPTVETTEPLARTVAPLPERWRPPHCRATAIADVPVRDLTMSATDSLPGLPDCTTLNLEAKP